MERRGGDLPVNDDEPVSVLRCIELALALVVILGLAGMWAYSWLFGALSRVF